MSVTFIFPRAGGPPNSGRFLELVDIARLEKAFPEKA
jgi:hypothetical protein